MVRISVTSTFIASLIGLAAATPVPRDNSLPTLKLGKLSGSLKDIVNKDEARLTRYHPSNFGNLASSSGSGSAPVINQVDSYIAEVTVGSQKFNLVVDTGSSNTWVGATTKYNAGSTGKDTGKSISVSYGSGQFSGEEFTDTVTLGSATVKTQSIGVAKTATGFTGVDGIIGFGPVDLTANTVNGASSVPTFMNNLKSTGAISTEVLGISFAPESGSDSNDQNGELTFGGTDASKFTGKITYVPLQGQYWGINVDGISYNGKSIGSANQAIVDTGTTLIYIPTDAFNAFSKATGGTTDQSSGLLSFTKEPTENVVFSIGGTDFALTPAQYLVPKDQYANNQLSGNKFFSWIGDGGSSSPGFILGMKFLENYYSVYDTANSRVGLATSALVSGGGSSSGSGSSSSGSGSSSTGSSSTGSSSTGSSSTGSSSSSSSSSTGLGDGSSSTGLGDGSSSTGFGSGSSSSGFGDGSSSSGFGAGSSSSGFGAGSSSSGFGDGSSSSGFGAGSSSSGFGAGSSSSGFGAGSSSSGFGDGSSSSGFGAGSSSSGFGAGSSSSGFGFGDGSSSSGFGDGSSSSGFGGF